MKKGFEKRIKSRKSQEEDNIIRKHIWTYLRMISRAGRLCPVEFHPLQVTEWAKKRTGKRAISDSYISRQIRYLKEIGQIRYHVVGRSKYVLTSGLFRYARTHELIPYKKAFSEVPHN
jgi:hypothetical protein